MVSGERPFRALSCLLVVTCRSAASPAPPRPDAHQGAPAGDRRDAYGGLPSLRAEPRGFFSVSEINGKHWLVSPEGNVFFSLGVNVARPGDIPRDVRGPDARWFPHQVDRMVSWHFNTWGAWSDWRFYGQRAGASLHRLPYVVNLELAKRSAEAGVPRLWDGRWNAFPDVFDPRFDAWLAANVAALVAPWRGDRYLIGYFSDNEQGWGAWVLGPERIGQILRRPNSAGARAFLEYLRETYRGDIDELNVVYGTSYGQFEDLLASLPDRSRITNQERAIRDRNGFLAMIAGTFYMKAYRSLKAHDANHLVLGDRFAGIPASEVVAATRDWVDVFSINYYVASGQFDVAAFGRLFEVSRRPWMVTEFSYTAADSGHPNRDVREVLTHSQADRASAYEDYLANAARLPFVVGLHWLRLVDSAPGEEEQSNWGLLTTQDRPYDDFLERVSAANAMIYSRH